MSISHITSVDLNRWNDKIISASGATGRRQNCNGALKCFMCEFIDWECNLSKFAPNQSIITAVSSDFSA